jgi:hypothetical protein
MDHAQRQGGQPGHFTVLKYTPFLHNCLIFILHSSHAAEVGMQVSFNLQRRVVNWDTFDHFKLGELVCLTADNSDKWIFAIVMFTDLSIIRRGIYFLSLFLPPSTRKHLLPILSYFFRISNNQVSA